MTAAPSARKGKDQIDYNHMSDALLSKFENKIILSKNDTLIHLGFSIEEIKQQSKKPDDAIMVIITYHHLWLQNVISKVPTFVTAFLSNFFMND